MGGTSTTDKNTLGMKVLFEPKCGGSIFFLIDRIIMKPLISKKYPVTHILNPAFVYVHSYNTNLVEDFRIRKMNAEMGKEPEYYDKPVPEYYDEPAR